MKLQSSAYINSNMIEWSRRSSIKTITKTTAFWSRDRSVVSHEETGQNASALWTLKSWVHCVQYNKRGMEHNVLSNLLFWHTRIDQCASASGTVTATPQVCINFPRAGPQQGTAVPQEGNTSDALNFVMFLLRNECWRLLSWYW